MQVYLSSVCPHESWSFYRRILSIPQRVEPSMCWSTISTWQSRKKDMQEQRWLQVSIIISHWLLTTSKLISFNNITLSNLYHDYKRSILNILAMYCMWKISGRITSRKVYWKALNWIPELRIRAWPTLFCWNW